MSTSRIARRWARGALLAVALGVGPAQARDSAYCRKVHALAATNASLLLWPKVTAEAVRYPFLDQAGGPTVLDTGIQLRLGLALSPTDMVQGARLDAAAEADCRLHEATESLKRVLAEAGDRAALAALQDQATFLLAHREEWKGLLAHGEGRRAAGVITIVEMEALRRLASQLERALAHAQGEAGRLERQLRRATAPVSLSAVSHRYVEAAMDLERQTVASPALDALRVALSGGVIPGIGRPSEWFGLVSINYQLGGLLAAPASRRYLEARREELEHADHELPAELEELRGDLTARVDGARRELEVVDGELATAEVTAKALGASTATLADHARDTVALERLLLQAERVYLLGLIERLSQLPD